MKMTTTIRRSYRTKIIQKGEIKGKGCRRSIPKSQKKKENLFRIFDTKEELVFVFVFLFVFVLGDVSQRDDEMGKILVEKWILLIWMNES